MIMKYGMSNKLGNMVFGSDEEVFLGKDFGHVKNYSERVAALIDEEVQDTIDSSYKKVISILNEKIDILHNVANRLLEKEKIEGPEFESIYTGIELPETKPETMPETDQNSGVTMA